MKENHECREEALEKQVKELKGKLMELAAISNNTVIEGSFKGEGVIKAATLMDICHKISDELNPKPDPEVTAEEKPTETPTEVKSAFLPDSPPEESKASNE